MRLNWAVLQIRLQNLPFPLEVMHNPFFSCTYNRNRHKVNVTLFSPYAAIMASSYEKEILKRSNNEYTINRSIRQNELYKRKVLGKRICFNSLHWTSSFIQTFLLCICKKRFMRTVLYSLKLFQRLDPRPSSNIF